MFVVKVDTELCEACGDCVSTCPNELLALVEEGSKKFAMYKGDPDDCLGCFSCESGLPQRLHFDFRTVSQLGLAAGRLAVGPNVRQVDSHCSVGDARGIIGVIAPQRAFGIENRGPVPRPPARTTPAPTPRLSPVHLVPMLPARATAPEAP